MVLECHGDGRSRALAFTGIETRLLRLSIFILNLFVQVGIMSIGKRKRDGGDSASDDEFEDESAMRARFQRAFEAKFKPLERLQPLRRIVEMGTGDANESNESDSDWSGLSADGDLVDVVHYDGTHDGQQQDDKLEKKAFMVYIGSDPSSCKLYD